MKQTTHQVSYQSLLNHGNFSVGLYVKQGSSLGSLQRFSSSFLKLNRSIILPFSDLMVMEPRHFLGVLCTPRIGLSRLCSATFEQLLAFGATFCGFSNLEQVLPFRAIFEQNIGLEHISSTKKSTISWKTSIHANFLKAYHVINLLNT